MARFAIGDLFRNWSHRETHCLCPYDKAGKLVSQEHAEPVKVFLKPWKTYLEERLSYGKTQLQRELAWWEYSLVFPERIRGDNALCVCEIATHLHVEVVTKPFIANRANPIFELLPECQDDDYHGVSGLLNASTSLFWLKQVCYNKGAGEEEERDRFEYAGGKVQQLPVPSAISDAAHGKPHKLAERLTALSRACWELGRDLPSLALRQLFEKSGEAYHAWNAALPGHVVRHAKLGAPFTSTAELQECFARAVSLREQLRAAMVARQEEMDWLVYAAYGLLAPDHPAAQIEVEPAPLGQAQRPFRLWESAGGDFGKAVGLIPADWPKPRRALWEARLAAIRDNEHIRRIEQPVYKRRWDEQWKVSNRWLAGPVAYAQEFVDAFRWWLAEKAEWHLEHKANGGPIDLATWTIALWKDSRIQAAWPVVAEALHQVAQFKFDQSEDKEARKEPKLDPSYESFAKFLKETVNDESVPAGIPPAVPWDDLAAKKKWTPAQLKKAQSVRGKLNVPRERFRQTEEGEFIWAGEK